MAADSDDAAAGRARYPGRGGGKKRGDERRKRRKPLDTSYVPMYLQQSYHFFGTCFVCKMANGNDVVRTAGR